MMFPEGTRSLDGRVRRFTDGAFYLAIKAKVPILPIAVDGSHACLPKHSFLFGDPASVRVKVLPPLETSHMDTAQASELRDTVRTMILAQLATWRSTTPDDVDGLAPPVPTS